jgi:predicted transcriptional regulator
MAYKESMIHLSIYIPQSKLEKHPIERLKALGDKLDRSLNYLVVNAVIEYLDREEKRG